MYSRILVPIDGSPTAERGLREAIDMAAQIKAHLVLLHIVDDYPMLLEMSSAATFEASRRHLLKFGEDEGWPRFRKFPPNDGLIA